ncbi:exodeoxyribonuclease III [Thermosulfurimonas marina]|uniref:Exodeoxyribonuclease III n=1 Tax=Thermosulfurimonas marina TaxID=2047767 RepID=A0A6H1WUV6_9BACT|nr:exodeoxyribonuclease III [Thermosulfurimonas marina]
MTLGTWNVNSLNARLEQVKKYLTARAPEVLCLQETKLRTEAFPREVFEPLGYKVWHAGGPGRNGVAILGRLQGEESFRGFPGEEDPQAEERVLAVNFGPFTVISVYVPNGSPVGSDYFLYKLEFLYRLRETLERHFDPQRDLLALCGDFNVAPEPLDVYDPELLEGQICFHERERAAFRVLLEWGLLDALRLKHPDRPGLYTWWDYQFGAFKANRGMRLDHILVTRPLAEHLRDSYVDREPRGWKRPSDHAPVITVFELPD